MLRLWRLLTPPWDNSVALSAKSWFLNKQYNKASSFIYENRHLMTNCACSDKWHFLIRMPAYVLDL